MGPYPTFQMSSAKSERLLMQFEAAPKIHFVTLFAKYMQSPYNKHKYIYWNYNFFKFYWLNKYLKMSEFKLIK